jgi:hypothetical protein
MLTNFRQGIIDGTNINYVSINADKLTINPDLIITIASGDSNYLVKITNPIIDILTLPDINENYYIYLDINNNAEISFGFINVPPSYGGTLPINPTINQHFFLTTSNEYNVWNGSRWNTVNRIFICEVLAGYNLNLYPIGTSLVGLNNITTNSGLILRYQNNIPIKKFENIKSFKFLTDVDNILIQKNIFSEQDQELQEMFGVATELIPEFSLINYSDGKVSLCSSFYDKEITGMTLKTYYPGQLVSIKRKGFIQNNNWNFNTLNIGNYAWLGDSGQPTDVVPTNFILLQQAGIICSSNSIYLDPKDKSYIGT